MQKSSRFILMFISFIGNQTLVYRFFFYAASGDVNKVREMLLDGMPVNVRTESDGFTALHHGAMNVMKSADVVNELLKNGAHVNAQTNYGKTPIYWAANCGNIDAMKALLQHGADPTIPSYDGETPLIRAHDNGHQEAMSLLENY